jgi:precorrin-2/cobalt-factor-2 C20-methyltransferase
VPGTLIGVGVGPGDADHLTVRALRVLRAADRIVAPSTAIDAVGRAESVVREAAPDLRVERLPYTMAPGAGARTEAARAAANAIVGWLDGGERVAFVTLGDPNVYSTFSSVAAEVRRLRPEVAVETVPGIMALQDLAARTGTVLLDDTESLTLVTALDGPAAVAEALGDPSRALVVYKGGRHLPELAKLLADAGRLDGAVMGELLGLPGQRTGPVADAAAGPATYLATVIVPPAGRRAFTPEPSAEHPEPSATPGPAPDSTEHSPEPAPDSATERTSRPS